MQVLARNTTISDIEINDLGGFIIPSDSTKELLDVFSVYELAHSDDILLLISSGSLVINNGSKDLLPSEAVRYINIQHHLNPVSEDGKEIIRPDSRPRGTHTVFTTIGDISTDIGKGKDLFWDFSNDDDIIVAPTGYKRKRIEIWFNESAYLKEGTLYFFDALKGSYLDMFVIAPPGAPYYNRNEELVFNDTTSDIKIYHFVYKHRFAGSCSMGDELNTEGCLEKPITPYHYAIVEVTVPDTDNSSYGWGEMELYRPRTCLFPGETV